MQVAIILDIPLRDLDKKPDTSFLPSVEHAVECIRKGFPGAKVINVIAGVSYTHENQNQTEDKTEGHV